MIKPNDTFQAGSRYIPIKIIFPYAILTSIWIYFSNKILIILINDPQTLNLYLDYQGLVYIFVSSMVLYVLFRAATYKLRISEKKYRHLFENAAVSIWEEDFSEVKKFFDQQRILGVSDWRVYFDNNPDSIKKCASLVKITNFNQEGLSLLGFKNKNEVPRNLDYYFTEQSFETFKEELIALAGGSTQWSGEGSRRTHDGRTKEFLFKLSVVPGHKGDLSKVLVSIININDQKEFEKELLHKEERLRQIIDLVPHFIFAKDIDGRFILVNKAVAEAYGTTVKNLIGKTDADFNKSPEEVEHFIQDDLEVIRSGKAKFIPQEIITDAKGQVRILSTTKIPFEASGTNSPCVLGVAVDITAHRNAEEALSQSQHFVNSILNATPNLIYVYDLLDQKNVYCNRETLEFLGYSPQQIHDMGPLLFVNILHPEDVVRVTKHHHSLVQDGDVQEIEYRIKDANDQWRWLRSRDVLFARTSSGRPWQILGSAIDITEHKNLEGKILTLANYDDLTSFPNRTLFLDRATQGLSHAKRNNTSCAVLFLDLDQFKNINDTLGHSVGDELLKDSASRISECIREIDTVARLGGDKFIIFLNGLEDAQSAQRIAERIREKFNSSRLILGHDLFVTASVGIATFPHDGNNLEELLKNADTAMSAAKDAGRNTFCFFDGTMNERAVIRMQIERGLRNALAKNELKLFYQPIIGVQDGRVRGFEALLRWFKSEGGMVPPNDFIGIAEDTGLIIPIGEWVLKEACQMGRRLQDMGYRDIVMSVNISVVQLRNKEIINVIKKALEEAGLSAHTLEIEVTESILISSFDASIEILKQIRDMGVKISLDDFGTGYSSLSHLHRLPITSLKIDRLFIKELMNEGVEVAMTATIIELAHTLNLGVIAEGVEHDSQLKSLAQENCDYFQGFLFGKPMPAEAAIAFLEVHSF